MPSRMALSSTSWEMLLRRPSITSIACLHTMLTFSSTDLPVGWGTMRFSAIRANWVFCRRMKRSARRSQDRTLASHLAISSLEISHSAATSVCGFRILRLPLWDSMCVFLSSISSTQVAIATLASKLLARRHARRRTPMEASPDVAAAQMLVPSAPMKGWKGPWSVVPCGLMSGCDRISLTRFPNALVRAGVSGNVSLKRNPSILAVRWISPVSASFFLLGVNAFPMGRNSAKGSHRKSDSSTLAFTSATVFSFVTETSEFASFPSDIVYMCKTRWNLTGKRKGGGEGVLVAKVNLGAYRQA